MDVLWIIYSPTVSDAKWSEQQLLAKLKEKPPQGEGYSYDLTPCGQKYGYVLFGFWGNGNPLLVEKFLCVVGIPVLCI